MKKYFIYILLSVSFLFSCVKEKKPYYEDDTTKTVLFDVVLKNGVSNFYLGDTVDYNNQFRVYLSDFNFYISDIYFHNANDSVLLDSILLADFDFFENKKSFELNYNSDLLFDSISFGVGVSQRMNGTDNPDFNALDYPYGHPLSPITSSEMYWSWAQGYRFVLFDGKFSSDNTSNLTNLVSIHTGPDMFYRYAKQKLNISSFTILEFRLDILNILDNHENGVFDLSNYNQYHGLIDPQITAEMFSNNFINSISIEAK